MQGSDLTLPVLMWVSLFAHLNIKIANLTELQIYHVENCIRFTHNAPASQLCNNQVLKIIELLDEWKWFDLNLIMKWMQPCMGVSYLLNVDEFISVWLI